MMSYHQEIKWYTKHLLCKFQWFLRTKWKRSAGKGHWSK